MVRTESFYGNLKKHLCQANNHYHCFTTIMLLWILHTSCIKVTDSGLLSKHSPQLSGPYVTNVQPNQKIAWECNSAPYSCKTSMTFSFTFSDGFCVVVVGRVGFVVGLAVFRINENDGTRTQVGHTVGTSGSSFQFV